MTRAAYLEARRVSRDMRPTREERGFPHHPDGTGRADCPDCEGAGEHTVNLSEDRYGRGPDPQCEESLTCVRCAGLGWVSDGHRDPIRDLREARTKSLSRRPGAAYVYGRIRQRVVSPVYLDELLFPRPIDWRQAA